MTTQLILRVCNVSRRTERPSERARGGRATCRVERPRGTGTLKRSEPPARTLLASSLRPPAGRPAMTQKWVAVAGVTARARGPRDDGQLVSATGSRLVGRGRRGGLGCRPAPSPPPTLVTAAGVPARSTPRRRRLSPSEARRTLIWRGCHESSNVPPHVDLISGTERRPPVATLSLVSIVTRSTRAHPPARPILGIDHARGALIPSPACIGGRDSRGREVNMNTKLVGTVPAEQR